MSVLWRKSVGHTPPHMGEARLRGYDKHIVRFRTLSFQGQWSIPRYAKKARKVGRISPRAVGGRYSMLRIDKALSWQEETDRQRI